MSTRIKSFEEYEAMYQRSVEDPEGFWAEQAASFVWQQPWEKILDWDFRQLDVKWFIGGK